MGEVIGVGRALGCVDYSSSTACFSCLSPKCIAITFVINRFLRPSVLFPRHGFYV